MEGQCFNQRLKDLGTVINGPLVCVLHQADNENGPQPRLECSQISTLGEYLKKRLQEYQAFNENGDDEHIAHTGCIGDFICWIEDE